VKARLLFAERDIELDQAPPAHGATLVQDLGLDALLDAMAAGDPFLRAVAERTLLNGLREPGEILYRQEIVDDCLRRPDEARTLYEFAVEALGVRQKAHIFWFHESADSQLQKGVRFLDLLLDLLRRLRTFADREEGTFRSRGLRTLLATLREELDDAYLDAVAEHVRALSFRRGALISAKLGRANRGVDYVLRKPSAQTLFQRVTSAGAERYSFTVPPRDESGHQSLAQIRGRGIRHASAAAAQAADHILAFFTMLRAELGFYVGCLNLQAHLQERGCPTCFPTPLPAEVGAFSASGLGDAALAFHVAPGELVGNDCDATGRSLVVITGANQGGKSTFLRSIGIAQLMLQAGMFVVADELQASVVSGVFTHFKREEDATMTHGKLDEELARMSELATLFAPAGLLLCNESFASTTEREGSEIARQIVRALREAGLRTFFVTHLYDLAHGWYEEGRRDTLFLRAERGDGGRRPFRLVEAKPLPTSYGSDSYRRIFGRKLPAANGA
jgi:DNA mismatch repair ATPase MutS